jgi:hypothetical protein
MDPTIIAAITGILGVILGAVIGGIFALKATKRQIEVMLLQSRGDVNERLYSQSLEIMRFFAENPELRPYFYDNKDLNEAPSELEKTESIEYDRNGVRLPGVGGAATGRTTCRDSAEVAGLYRRWIQLQRCDARAYRNLHGMVRR